MSTSSSSSSSSMSSRSVASKSASSSLSSTQRLSLFMERVGFFWTTRKRIASYLLMFVYYVLQVSVAYDSAGSASNTAQEAANKSTIQNNYPYTLSNIKYMDIILLVLSIAFLLIAWFNYYKIDSYTLLFDGAIVGISVGWILLVSIVSADESYSYLKIFLTLNILFSAWLVFVDVCTQRIRPGEVPRLFRRNTFNLLRSKASPSAAPAGMLPLKVGGRDGNPESNAPTIEIAELVHTNTHYTENHTLSVPLTLSLDTVSINLDGTLAGSGSPNLNLSPSVGLHDPTETTINAMNINNGQRSPQPSYSRNLATAVTHHQLQQQQQQLGVTNSIINSNSNNGDFQSLDLTNLNIFEGFRANLSKLPRSHPMPAENLTWDVFSSVVHRIDSSSCHIYTALWQDTPVIIKLIKAERVNSPVALSEFEMEVGVLTYVSHPHIVRLLGSGHVPRRFLVLELLDGGSLSHSLGLRPDANKRIVKQNFTYVQNLKMARAIASSFDYLHVGFHPGINIIHRDLKPDNIGWKSDGTLKIFDFGLCACVRAQRDKSEQYRLTGNTGTLRYMAPEVALGRSYNKSVDVYSFGVILWQLLKGKVPYRNISRKMHIEKVVIGGYRMPLDPKWSPRLQSLIRNCWHEDKAQRPEFREVLRDLDVLILEAEEAESMGWSYYKNTLSLYWQRLRELVYWSRPGLLVLCCLLAVVTVVIFALHLDVGQQSDTRREDLSNVSGAWLLVVTFYILYLVTMSYLRGSLKRLSSAQNIIMALEMSHTDDIESGNPVNNGPPKRPYGL